MNLPPDFGRSLLELGLGAFALVFFTLRFAHARVAAADVALLAKLRAEGLLGGDAREDYRTLTRLLHTLSPAAVLRTEFWVGPYYVAVLITQFFRFRDWSGRQLHLLAAHQAGRYQIAVGRLNALRSE